MRIGIDFDNTIVCYDYLFHRVCVERGLIPASLPANKSEVRNYLRQQGREDDWTEMQGYVYGARMLEAAPFPGVIDFFSACKAKRIDFFIISHKTKHPYLGEKYDLHQAAQGWLEHLGFYDMARTGLTRERVFFETAKQAKIQRIAACQCSHFIDDLPEFLAEIKDQPQLVKLLFDPNALYPVSSDYLKMGDWKEAGSLLL